jgi:N-acetylmuramoyl-L-alanine amidase
MTPSSWHRKRKQTVLTNRLLFATSLFFLTASCSSSSETQIPKSAGNNQLLAQTNSPNQNPFGRASESPAAPIVDSSPIKVVYPSPNNHIPAATTFIVGACNPADSLFINGLPVKLNAQGFFAHVVALKPGENNFALDEKNEKDETIATRKMKVFREVDTPAIADADIRIKTESFTPAENRGVRVGEIVEFSISATPDSQVSVFMGTRKITLRTLQAARAIKAASAAAAAATASSTQHSKGDLKVNTGMDTAYGQVFQRHPHARRDQYFGYYKVTAEDRWNEQKPKVVLSHGDKTLEKEMTQAITTVEQPLIAETVHDLTIVRLGPNASRTTPLVSDIRLLVDGWIGDQVSCLYAPNKHVWIDRKDLNFETDGQSPKDQAGSGPPPFAQARTINIKSEANGEYISVPLNQRLAYQVEQNLTPNQLKLHIFGVTANTDWVSDTPEDSKLIEGVTFNQKGDNNYEITVALKGLRQWGYKVDYDGDELRLHVRHAPDVALTGAKPLQGIKICVDPGHGGAKEKGAVGCSGIYEAAINLAISLKFRDLLEAQGAQVIMTRTTDTEVSLEERVKIADQNNVDLLLSVHNNSLPDGRDPLKEHGSSTYWYHPQSTELGKALKNGLIQKLHFPDIGSRFQNLALTRPSGMQAVLSEVGFMINPDEYAVLISEKGQQDAAQGLLNGLKAYLAKEKANSAL